MPCDVRASHDDEPALCPTCIVHFLSWVEEKFDAPEEVFSARGVTSYARMEALVREFKQYRVGE